MIDKPMDTMGEMLQDGDRIGLRFVRHFSHPLERVWSAITESDQLRYWMPCDIVGERRAGADIELPFWPAQVANYQLEDPFFRGRMGVGGPLQISRGRGGGDVRRFEWEPSDGE